MLKASYSWRSNDIIGKQIQLKRNRIQFVIVVFFIIEIITESLKAGEKKEKKTKEKTEKIEDVANDVDAKKKAEPEKKGDPPVIEGQLQDVVSWRGRCFKQTMCDCFIIIIIIMRTFV